MDNNQPKIDVDRLIDQSSLTAFQIIVIGLSTIVAMLDGFDTQAIAFVTPIISTEWGIDKANFGPIFSSGLAGLAVGAFTLGAFADRIGRKTVIAWSTLIFGCFSLLTAITDSLNQIMIMRFLTGLGLGGAIPNIIAITSEFSPKRLKTLMVVVMFCGFPLGGLLGGFMSSWLVLAFGWESVFIAGGVLPLCLLPVLIYCLPESIPFLVRKKTSASNKQVAKYLKKISPATSIQEGSVYFLQGGTLSRGSIRHLFSENRALGSVLLWLIFFTNLLMFYFLISWLPTLLLNAGLPINLAIITAVLLNAGTITGGVCLGYCVDKVGAYKILPVNYLAAAVFTLLIGYFSSMLIPVAILVFFAGFCVGGGQIVANGLAATYYPVEIRSTGVGWAFGFGRVGAIIGPIIGGLLLSLGFDTVVVFTMFAAPGLSAAIAVYILKRMDNKEAITSISVKAEDTVAYGDVTG